MSLVKPLNKIVRAGCFAEMSYKEHRRLIVLNIAGLIAGSCSALFLVSNYISGYYILCWLDFLTLFASYSIPLFHHWRITHYPALFAVVLYSVCCTFSAYHYNNNTEFFLPLFMGVSFFVWDDKRVMFSVAIFNAALFFFIQSNKFSQTLNLNVPFWNRNAVLLIILCLYIYFLYYFKRQNSRYQHRIEYQNRELHAINLHKEKIVSVIAHDIRSPLAAVYSSLSLLKEGELNPQEFDGIVGQLLSQVSNLQVTMGGLLEWGKRQLTDPKPQKTVFSLKTILPPIIDLLKYQVHSKNLEIDTENVRDINFFADPNHIEIILRNLLSNAIKFSYPGTTITIVSKANDNIGLIEIHDVGVGIKADDLRKLFDTAEMHTTYGTHNEKGNGLGLKLCREFAKINNGDLIIKSQLKKGTVTTLTIPLTPDAYPLKKAISTSDSPF